MNPCDIIRSAAATSIDLNIREGQLFARLPDTPPADVLTAIREHKPAIIAALTWWPGGASLCAATLDRCRPLTPDDLTATERIEAETLAADLRATGGLGWFVICLTGNWNHLTDRDRLAAAYAWQVASGIQSATDRIAA